MKISWFFICWVVFSNNALCQELEARAYGNLPKNMNAVALVYAISKGHVLAEPSLPIEDFNLTTHNIGLRYVRTFALANKLARISIALPFVRMAGQLQFSGQDTSGTRIGFGDTRVQFGINLIGSPALEKKDFIQYSQKTIVGISLITSVPTGLYYPGKRINIGGHRWAFKPEIGASRKFKSVYTDGYIGIWFFAHNTDYLKTNVLKQDPLFSAQLHGSYYFRKGMMIGINGNWFSGGKIAVDNVPNGPKIDHWRMGGTWAMPLGKGQLVKLQFHTSVHANTGYNYDVVAVGYQYVFF